MYWLRVVAARTLADWFRSSATRPTHYVDIDVLDPSGPESDAPDVVAQCRGLEEKLFEKYCQLSDEERFIVDMRREGYRNEDIAKALGISPGHVSRTWNRLYREFRNYLF